MFVPWPDAAQERAILAHCMGVEEAQQSLAQRDHTTTKRLIDAAFLACLFVSLLPVLHTTYFPTVDGPAHVYTADLLRRYFVARDPLARALLTPIPAPLPNYLVQTILSVLLQFFSAAVAERFVIGGFVVLLPLAIRYGLRSVSPRASGLEFLAFPLLYSQQLFWGFFNFCYSLALFWVGFGYWLRHTSTWSWRRAITLTLLAILIYLAHPAGLVALLIFVGIHSVAELKLAGRSALLERLRKLTAYWSLAFGPALVLYCWAALKEPLATLPVETAWPSFRSAAAIIATLSPLAVFSRWERLGAASLSFMILIAVASLCIGTWPRLQGKRYLVALAVSVGLIFVVPSSAAGATLITPRLVYFPLFAAFCWLTIAATRRWRIILSSSAVAIALYLWILQWPYLGLFDRHAKEFMTARSAFESRHTLAYAPVDDHLPGQPSIAPPIGIHLPGYLAVEKQLLDLSDYQPASTKFPFRFRFQIGPELRSPQNKSQWDWQPSLVDALHYEDQTGVRVDYLMQWTTHGGEIQMADTVGKVEGGVASYYEQLHSPEIPSWMRVYRRTFRARD